MLDLITSRTLDDALMLQDILHRVYLKGRDSLSADEEALLSAQTLGSYNASDRNRVGNAVRFLSGLLVQYGYTQAEIEAKIDWPDSDAITIAESLQYLDGITSIKNAFYGTTPLPASMDNLDYEGANNIERLLEEISQYIDWMIASFHYSNQFYSGEYVEIADISFLQRRTMGELEPYTMAELSQLTMNQLMYGW